MAPTWPQEAPWSPELREHATLFGTYLRQTINSIEREGDQHVPVEPVKMIIRATLALIEKTLRATDYTSIQTTMNSLQAEAKRAALENTKSFESIRKDLKDTMDDTQRGTAASEEAKSAAREAVAIGKSVASIAKEIKNKGIQQIPSMPTSYAAVVAHGAATANTYNTQAIKATSPQAQREIIVNIRNAHTIQSLRAMNPRNLKAHIERALTQSENEHVSNIKIMSTNQLKSGDLSIRTSTNSEMQALRTFTEDWTHRIGLGASVHNPTFGVLVHGIRTNTMDMAKVDEIKANILLENRPFLPNADIKYIGWLRGKTPVKAMTSIIIEFSKPEDANKIIDEGLVWQSELCQCERYERQCRLKQCFNCQKYGHIGTQCKATTKCGYCAQEHSSRECPTKTDKDAPRKCANCHGTHEAWRQQCQMRKGEMARIEAAHAIRPKYHPIIDTPGLESRRGDSQGSLRYRKPARDQASYPQKRMTEGNSTNGRGQKRTNTGQPLASQDKENEPLSASQRPQRAAMPSRRALEALAVNALTQRNMQMDIDTDTES
jgi:hypothetical protein